MARGVVWWALAGVCVLACGSEDDSVAAPDAVCGGVCEAAARCRVNASTSSCRGNCLSSSDFSRVSREGGKALGDCLAGVGCNAFDDDTTWADGFDACWQRAKPAVAVTEQVRSLCASYVEQVFECDGVVSTHDCELNFGMWAPSVLDQVKSCFGAAHCDALYACIESVFGS